MASKMTFDDFVKRSIDRYGNKYGYSLAKIDYVNTRTKIRIICPIHGESLQNVRDHLRGHGCKQCGYDNNSKDRSKGVDQFIKDSIMKHGDIYDYSLVEYIHSKHNVEIVCKEHGSFWKSPNHHLKGQGCPDCSENIITKINTIRHENIKENFKTKAIYVHSDRYKYLSGYVDSYTKVKIQCNTCNLEFYQIPQNHLSGQGCPYCKKSKGEKKIEDWLQVNNIEYFSQKWFSDCRGVKRPLPFDFWIPSKNILIEFQGKQHYELVNFMGGMSEDEISLNFENTKCNDQIKRDYCLNNKIQLLEIPYWDIKNIDKILTNKIGELL